MPSFFKAINNNCKCAICENKKCKLRYHPDRKSYQFISGDDGLHRVVNYCPKEYDKMMNNKRNRKLP